MFGVEKGGKEMIRRIDELGRLVIPIEMRKKLDISICDSVNIVVKNKKIIITKSDFTSSRPLPATD